ncbi:hypothetical protein [Brevundimonas sp.]|uniref:hypothetical protein n=1 Tax=Brevundimonas sp. TaxID=1871086 RepID=UPI002D35C4B8|nr:hypothetical protein [Brevundimonas sp.]HYC68578.1 hypothetical protein [Brevundimonas sp.]
MKPLLFAAAAVLLLPAAAQAQVAAATVPNTFDDPAARARPVTPPPAPAAAPALSPDRAHPESEDILRTLIASAQAGAMDYALMSDDLAAKVREQEATVTPIIDSFGALVAVDFIGSQDRNDLFSVTFANAATEWVIGVNDDGKVAALLFRPAS